MAGQKQQQGIDSKLARKFIKTLAKELVSDSERGFCLASNTQDIKDALLESADSLPAGKLHSTLILVLQQQNLQEAFVSALQNEIRVLSAKLELHSDVLLNSSASDRVFQTLVTCVRGTGTSLFTDTKSRHAFSQEDIHLLVYRDPPPDILWALTAMKLSSAKSVMLASKYSSAEDVNSSAFSTSSSSASAFLRCVKPWIVGRSSSIAVAALAPLAPLVFESLQQSSSRSAINIKALRALIKEVMSFIVVINCKEDFMTNGSGLECGSWECLSFSALYDGFSAVFKASQLHDIVTQMEGLSTTEKLKLMFPLASELTKKALEMPDVKISVLADIVKVEFLLLHMVLEVIYCSHKTNVGGKVGVTHGRLDDEILEPMGSAAISGVGGVHNDLILDVLLSDLSVSNLLDDRERSVVRFSIFKALLMESSGFSKKHVAETSASNRKAVGTFLKRIAVARKIKTSERTRSNILEDLICYSKVPCKLSDNLKSCNIIKKPPEKALLNDRALIGWLLHLDDMEFQAVVDGTSRNDIQADENMAVKKDDLYTVRSSPDYPSIIDSFNQDEPEDLFFLDTTGEDKGQGDDNPSLIRQSRKTRKRKERPVLFHRRGSVIKRKEGEGTRESSSDSSDSSAGSMQEN